MNPTSTSPFTGLFTPSSPGIPIANRRTRRALVKHHKKAGTASLFSDQDLTDEAFKILKADLETFGSKLSGPQRDGLYCIVGRMTMLATGAVAGRYAYGLATGCGKTRSIIAWCTALARLKKPYSVVICCSKVDALCEIKEALLEAKVPEEMIGIRHSYAVGQNGAKFPATADNENRQILLVTHARVRGKSNRSEYDSYRGKPRSLLVWDESLLTGEHQVVEVLDFERALGSLRPILDRNRATPDQARAIQYLEACWEVLSEELASQERDHHKPLPVRLDPLCPDDLAQMTEALGAIKDSATAVEFLKISQAPLRVIANSGFEDAYIKYDLAVPPELNRVAILDASYPIRELERLDTTINEDPAFKAILERGPIKRYDAVAIHWMNHASGRGAMTKDFGLPRRGRKISREVVEVLKSIPQGEAAIVFTFKKRGKVDMNETLRDDLKAVGIDPDEKMPDGQDRFIWLTWGQETATSKHSYAKNVVFAGVLHRSESDLAGAMIAQKDELTCDVTKGDISSVQRSEVAHYVYQAISRSACRITQGGQGLATNVWIFHWEEKVKEILREVMPGVCFREWQGIVLGKTKTKTEERAKLIAEYLEGLPKDTQRVSIRFVKDALGLHDIKGKQFNEARKRALQMAHNWDLEDRSFVRL